ncbi:hypothetical protein L1887_04517 [Cichorium endivia]|nr:hypothetical protein L1887_04517 [Cichorium endivia]
MFVILFVEFLPTSWVTIIFHVSLKHFDEHFICIIGYETSIFRGDQIKTLLLDYEHQVHRWIIFDLIASFTSE